MKFFGLLVFYVEGTSWHILQSHCLGWSSDETLKDEAINFHVRGEAPAEVKLWYHPLTQKLQVSEVHQQNGDRHQCWKKSLLTRNSCITPVLSYIQSILCRCYRVLMMMCHSGLLCFWTFQWLRLALSNGPNKVSSKPHPRMKTDPVSKTMYFPIFRIADSEQSP
jgi:hypothetical protein